MIYEYTLPGIPPSLNQYLGQNRRFKYEAKKKEWAKIIKYSCLKKPLKPIKHSRITITYHFPDNRRRDPDNYAGKFLLDGLRDAGIIEDDSFWNVDLHPKATFGNGKANQRTVILIEELEENG